ncbi:pyruvate formate lyase family protein [Clostridium sp. E02]|uniref:pyruvate formate lyase family protein n=1 Tax=Clostridium sp. E02 TaxID=2487134 RepID=UPI000F523374|nr:pyruvate formate lyase family protein [Clostridium sp. E02]
MRKRLEKLKKVLFESYYLKKEWWGDDLSIFDDDPLLGNQPLVIRKAIATQKVCREMPISLISDELIVGKPTMSSVGYGHTFPRYETIEEEKEAAKYNLNRKSVWGHHNPSYKQILERGILSIIEEAIELKNKVLDDQIETKNWYESVIISLKSVEILSNRYSKLLETEAEKEESQERKKELFNMSKICSKVPMQPASNFHEALQSVWFIHVILHSTLNYTSIGRLDQYLWPFYKNDLDNGMITTEYAEELLGSFLIKFNERIQLNNDHIENHLTFGDMSQGGNLDQLHYSVSNEAQFNFGQTSNSWLQNCILSGITPDGDDATNDLTYMIMELVRELEITNPMVSVRLHKNSPTKLFKSVAKVLSDGGAQPTIFNDDVLVPGLVKHLGIPEEDARDYSNDGCWETLPQGRTQSSFGHIDLLLCLESVINQGKSLINEKPIGSDYGNPVQYKTFNEFFEAFKMQLKESLQSLLEDKIINYEYVYQIAPDPLLSGLLEDCLKNGKDITQKGARYKIYAPLVAGLSHCADSLAAIKYLVYETKTISIEQLRMILKNNWKNEKKLQQYVLNKVPKYGNDDDYVDSISVDLLESYCNYCDEWNRKIDWLTIAPGVGTFENYAKMGYLCGASADGRLSQESLSSNYSPSFGMDKDGPTSIIRSSIKFNLQRLNNGCPIDLRIDVNKSDQKKSIEVLSAFVKSFIIERGNILTVTTVSTETLLAAQKEPEKYGSLRVRLGGLTAYFVQLCKTQQDEYIRRTQHEF